MRHFRYHLQLALGLAMCCGFGLVAADDVKSDVKSEMTAEITKRFQEQDKEKEAAIALKQKGAYDEAIKKLQNVVSALELEKSEVEAQRVAARLDEFREEIASVKYLRGVKALTDARVKRAEKKWEDARSLARRALEVPELKSKAQNFITACNDEENEAKIIDDQTLENVAPKHAENRKELKKLIGKAKNFCKAKRYSEALKTIESAYKIDPCDMEVIALSGQIYRMLYEYGRARRRADMEGVLSNTQWQWAEPVFDTAPSVDNTDVGLVRDTNAQDSYEKLRRIVFDRVEFEDTEITAIISFLRERSSTFDPERAGVNINAMINPANGEMPRLSMSFTNIPMDTLLRYICQMTGLKYKVDHDGSVTIGYEVEDLETDKFTVRGNLIKSIIDEVGEGDASADANATAADAGAKSSNDSGVETKTSDDGSAVATTTVTVSRRATATPAQMVKYFTRRGVKFPEGSTISYISAKSEIIARNTNRNLQKLKELINQHNNQSKLVVVEIKAIEITENDLQELGFHWSMNDLGASTRNATWVFKQGENTKGTTQDGLQMVRGGFSSTGFTDETVDSAVVKNLNIFPMLFGSKNPFGSDTALNIGLTINALSRNDRTETLSAPKLLALDGKEAYIETIRRYYFPQSWDTIEVEVETSDNSSQVTITPPVPSFSDSGDPIGITFKVTPRVLDDNRTIQLDLNPKFTSYLGKDEWPVNIYGYYNKTSTNIPVIGDPDPTKESYNYYFNIWRPIIARREMQVKLNVYDGETVVLGGIVESSNVGRTDKVPILGDLPLIGRFFQSQADDITRTNLLIFVTAKLMKNDGTQVNASRANGAPEFNR